VISKAGGMLLFCVFSKMDQLVHFVNQNYLFSPFAVNLAVLNKALSKQMGSAACRCAFSSGKRSARQFIVV
jgi:hypothetical protein